MKYALVNTSNEVIRTQDFTDTPPMLSEAKGLRWIEYVESAQEIAAKEAIAEAQRKSAIIRQLDAGDRKIIRAVLEGDTMRIDAWKSKAAELRSQL